MSEVLEAFIAPYAALAETEDALRRPLTVVVAAWNASLLPDEEQKEMVDQLVATQSRATRRDRKDLKHILYDLIERKKTHFPDNRRFIVDFHPADAGDGFHVSVASTLMPRSQAPDPDSTHGHTRPS
jgi:hypothetical protein